MKGYTVLRPSNRDEWLEIRKNGIGSSEVGTLLGLNPFQTAYQLWEHKLDIVPPTEENFAMKAGHYLEPAVAQFFADETGAKIIKNSAIDFIVRDDDKPFLQASPDRYFTIGKEKCILECKTTQNSIDADDLPKHWYVQVMYQLGINRMKRGAIAWLTAGREFGFRWIEYDDELFKFIVSKVEEFWWVNVCGHQEPDIANSSDIERKFKNPEGDMTADNSLINDIDQLRTLKRTRKELDGKIDELEEGIKMHMLGKERIVTDEGRVLVTWRKSKESIKLDSERLKKERADIYSQFTVSNAGTRRFMVNG